ncbi:MAG: xylulokinase [Streptosporangiaceae bacterium]
MPSDGVILGLDLGTSQVKALVCAPDGTVLGQGLAGYGVSTPRAGWAETDPEDWWQAACAAVRTALGPAPAEVAGLAVVGQMHGVVLCAERSVVLRPAILWLDRRAAAETGDYLRLPPDLRARLGNAPTAGMAGPILLWLSRHEPDAYRRARWMLLPKDWLRLRLTGQAATDPTDASGTLLFDIGRDTWATEVADALGLRTDLLPPIRPSAQIAGHLQPAAARQLGLRPGLPVATGAADTAASMLAAALPPGWGLLTLGTGGQLIVPDNPPPDNRLPDSPPADNPFPDNSLADGRLPDSPDPYYTVPGERDGSGRTSLFRAVGAGTYRLAGAQNVGVTLDWVRRTLGATWDELYGTAARPWQADTPIFLPYLASERGDDHDAGGTWAGLTLAHQRDDLMRAALEGVAFLLRDHLEAIRAVGARPGRIQLAGGGTAHPAWRQLLADVLGVPLYPGGAGWLTARGATTIAARAAGLVTGAGTTDRSAEKSPVDPSASQLAEASYRRFRSAASRQSR